MCVCVQWEGAGGRQVLVRGAVIPSSKTGGGEPQVTEHYILAVVLVLRLSSCPCHTNQILVLSNNGTIAIAFVLCAHRLIQTLSDRIGCYGKLCKSLEI